MDDSSDARARTSERASASAPMGGFWNRRDGVERASGVERVARAAGRAMDGGARSTSTHGMSRRQPSRSRGASGARASGKRRRRGWRCSRLWRGSWAETESLVFDAGAARRDAREDSREQNDRTREASGSGTATTSMVGAFFGGAGAIRRGAGSTEFWSRRRGRRRRDGAADAVGKIDARNVRVVPATETRSLERDDDCRVRVRGRDGVLLGERVARTTAMRHIHLSSLSELSCENAFIPARARGRRTRRCRASSPRRITCTF